MPSVVPAVVNRQRNSESTRFVQEDPHRPSGSNGRSQYGSVGYIHQDDSPKSKISRIEESDEDDQNAEGEERFADDQGSDDGLNDTLDVTWRYMSRMYLLVPFVTLLFTAALILLITFAWPPNKHERKHGQTYPHNFMWKPLLVGIFASCTIQTLRVPIWVAVTWLGIRPGVTSYLSTIFHSILHELVRLSTLPLSLPSPTSGFHSSYYLGLGWGIAEAIWGIIQGYEQLALYQDVMLPDHAESEEIGKIENGQNGLDTLSDVGSLDEEQYLDEIARADEAELEKKVEALERMRERRDLEAVFGSPFPSIPLALHILWRLDTLLLNLGLTLILSSFYYDPIPIYKHPIEDIPRNPAMSPSRLPSPYLWTVWTLVALAHVAVSLVWKNVGRVGVGAVTWGGLIVALGSVFAGLGGWGGLV